MMILALKDIKMKIKEIVYHSHSEKQNKNMSK